MRICLNLLFLTLSVATPTIANEIHQWAIEVKGGKKAAEKLADDVGLTLKGQIGTLKFFLFEGYPPNLRNRSESFSKRFSKREVFRETVGWLSNVTGKLSQHSQVKFFQKQIPKKRVKRSLATFNDPFWPKSWYLLGEGNLGMNVEPVWEKGYTGRNVVVSILDDGIEKDHPDLIRNYDPAASWDINSNDSDPSPRYDRINTNRHGTRCAGEIVAVANNSICSVGVAFNAKIGGVRMLDGPITDAVEATALSLNPQHIDIYSASWGPNDDGHSMDAPGVLAQKALVQGVTKGRGGKGSIFVWASGNGGANQDSCAYDGYASSIYTISVSSTTENGLKPYYLEECASTLATTYSSGNSLADHQVVTTDINHSCTEFHSGTSASAALAAGMIALVIEANPRLTWRDVQHIIVETSRTEPLLDALWFINSAGKKVSSRYGFGLLDGLALVELAEKWQTVSEQIICESKDNWSSQIVKGNENLAVPVTMNTCDDGRENVIGYLEHVQVRLSLELSIRGDIAIFLTSPSGTSSQLLPPRSLDKQPGNFNKWLLTSVQFWGEASKGTWRLELINTGNETNSGTLTEWQLILYGTQMPPRSVTMPYTTRLPEYGLTSTANLRNSTSSSKTRSTTTLRVISNGTDDSFIGAISAGFAFAGLLVLLAVLLCRRYTTNNAYTVQEQETSGSIATLSNNVPMIELQTKGLSSSPSSNC